MNKVVTLVQTFEHEPEGFHLGHMRGLKVYGPFLFQNVPPIGINGNVLQPTQFPVPLSQTERTFVPPPLNYDSHT